jgi:alanine-synthesizing transaminase
MFSRRIPGSFEPNRLSAAVARKRALGTPLLDLTVTNPIRAGLASPRDLEAFTAAARNAGSYEPEAAGLLPAREAVALYYADQGIVVDPADVILTASTSEAYAALFKLLGDPGDEFLAPRPSYPLFDPLASLESVRLRDYPLHYDGRWWLDREALLSAVSPLTRGIITVEPNNPTGSFLDDGERDTVLRLCRERGFPLIADEVFRDFAGPAPASLAASAEALTFVLSGLSKVTGQPGLKLGWIVLAGPAGARKAARERLEWIADTFLSVGTPVQEALPALLAGRNDFQARTRSRIEGNELWLDARLAAGSSVERLRREGGWSIVLRVPRLRGEEEWCLELLDLGVVLHPGHFYDFETEAFLVASLITQPDVVQEGRGRLLRLADG